MSGNGPVVFIETTPTMAGMAGKLSNLPAGVCCAAGPGSSTKSSPVAPTATTSSVLATVTTSSAFGWCVVSRPHPEPLATDALISVALLCCSLAFAVVERLARLRLTIHGESAQVVPVKAGIPWLGFVVYLTHSTVKARKVRCATRHLGERLEAYHAGRISFAVFDASIKGWVNHVRYADTWGLRKKMFSRLVIR